MAASVLFCAVRYTSKFFCLEKAVFHGSHLERLHWLAFLAKESQ